MMVSVDRLISSLSQQEIDSKTEGNLGKITSFIICAFAALGLFF
jgi:hypothetical protein